VLAASVLDFVPSERLKGKVSSQDELKVSFKATEKIIGNVKTRKPIKVDFKLETELNEKKAAQIAQDYGNRYQLSMMVLNRLSDVSATKHAALLFERQAEGMVSLGEQQGKQAVAHAIAAHVTNGLLK